MTVIPSIQLTPVVAAGYNRKLLCWVQPVNCAMALAYTLGFLAADSLARMAFSLMMHRFQEPRRITVLGHASGLVSIGLSWDDWILELGVRSPGYCLLEDDQLTLA